MVISVINIIKKDGQNEKYFNEYGNDEGNT